MKQFYTYLHCKPDGTPFYVGKGHDAKGKKRSYDFKTGRNKYHHHIVDKYGAEHILVYVFTCDSEAQALADEIQQIAQLRREGYKLCNLSDGGDGPSGYKHTEEAKKKMSKFRKGKKYSAEWCAKISASNKGKTISKEAREKISKKLTGIKLSDAVKEKISKSLIGNTRTLGHKLSDETKKKISDALKGNNWCLGHKQSQETIQKRINTRIQNKKFKALNNV